MCLCSSGRGIKQVMRHRLSESPTWRSERCHPVAGWLCHAAKAWGGTYSDGALEEPSWLHFKRNVKERDMLHYPGSLTSWMYWFTTWRLSLYRLSLIFVIVKVANIILFFSLIWVNDVQWKQYLIKKDICCMGFWGKCVNLFKNGISKMFCRILSLTKWASGYARMFISFYQRYANIQSNHQIITTALA